VKYDKGRFDAAGLEHHVVGNLLRVSLPEHHCDLIEIMLDGAGEMDLVVDRSHYHRVIASMLGAPAPSLPGEMK
jgi:hypothetical protein